MRWTTAQLDAFQARRRPPDGPAPRKRRAAKPRYEASEDVIHRAVVEHLWLRSAPGVVWWHTPNGELRDLATARKLKALGTRPGVPDLALVIEGRAHFLELKTRKGRLSLEQRQMHASLLIAGAIVETAHGVDQAISTLVSWGALLPAKRKRTTA